MDIKLPSYNMFKSITHKKTTRKTDESARGKGEALWSKFCLGILYRVHNTRFSQRQADSWLSF